MWEECNILLLKCNFILLSICHVFSMNYENFVRRMQHIVLGTQLLYSWVQCTIFSLSWNMNANFYYKNVNFCKKNATYCSWNATLYNRVQCAYFQWVELWMRKIIIRMQNFVGRMQHIVTGMQLYITEYIMSCFNELNYECQILL